MKYIKKFENHTEYETFTGTTEFILPNVSLCKQENEVHYNPVIQVTGVTLDKNILSISKGKTNTLVATVLPEDAFNKSVVWSSSDESIATVDDNGLVTAVGNIGDDATITVTTKNGGYTAQCAISIVKPMDTITYTATAKLPETIYTSSSSSGLHINSFSGTSGQQLTMVSHTFEDGVGTVTFNGDIAEIGESAFYYCNSLTSIVIPNSVTSIGSHTFESCSKLTSATIGSGVTSIGEHTFYGCTSLTSIDIPDSVTSIGNYAFSGCTALQSIDIPSGVTSIGSRTFCWCTSLTSATIGNGVTSIGDYAFFNCKGLTTCTIGSGVTDIGGYYVFGYCSSLTSIVSNATTAPTISNTIFQNVKTGGTLTVPSGSSGYDVWMGTGDYYLGKYGWTKIEQ